LLLAPFDEQASCCKGKGDSARTLKAGAPVALAILGPNNPYTYVKIRGRVGRVTEAGAAEHIDSLAKTYLGQDKDTGANPGKWARCTRSSRPLLPEWVEWGHHTPALAADLDPVLWTQEFMGAKAIVH
jgi:hypothetical protein